MRFYNYSRSLAPLLAITIAAMAGCGKSELGLVPVTGVVLLDGNPLSTGTLTTSKEEGLAARGTIRSDGTFTLETRGVGEGAEIGKHLVAVLAYESADPGNPEARKKLLVPAKYTNAFSSGLEVEVGPEGARDVKLELTSK